MTISLPSNFTLASFRFDLQAREPFTLPPFWGSALRGAFGHTFKRLVCREPWPCDKKCRRGNICPYGYIFETSPEEGTVLRNLSDVPRPFIIRSPAKASPQISAGDRLRFDLTLVGQSRSYLPYFIAVFRELGRVGLGKQRGKYRLEQVTALSPSGQASRPIYRAGDETIHAGDNPVTIETILARAATLPADRLTLQFLTPTRLKHQGRWVNEGPPFAVLVKALLGRISSLSYFHCGQPFEADFRGLIDRAGAVRLVNCQTRWEDWSRFSGRQKRRIEMGGLVGQATYEGELGDYLPLLALGEQVHVGKGAVFGNGWYEMSD